MVVGSLRILGFFSALGAVAAIIGGMVDSDWSIATVAAYFLGGSALLFALAWIVDCLCLITLLLVKRLKSATRFDAFVSSSPDSGRIDMAVAEETR
jgi:hypothetical protein